MEHISWSPAEKRKAREIFDRALKAELAEILARFKADAALATTTDEMWKLGELLDKKRVEIDEKYDYRYSQLLIVFGRLLREHRVTKEELQGIFEQKKDYIFRVASL